MKKLSRNIENLIFEDVDNTSVELAIKKRLPIKANYVADDDPRGSGWRIIQPVAYGLSKAGNPVVRAYQPFGDTKTKVPHWKLFRLDRFENWNPIKKKTNIPEPPLSEYNPDGDKSMSTVYLNADFAGAKQRYERGGLSKFNKERHTQKIAQNPYYDLQKNIERSKRIGTMDNISRNVASWDKEKSDFMRRWLNGDSAEDMSKTADFGDNTFVQTNEPIRKQDVTGNNGTLTSKSTQPQENPSVYKNIATNGPVTKTSEIEKPDIEPETTENEKENNNIENNNNI